MHLGDIILPSSTKMSSKTNRNVVPSIPELLWENGRIPFKYSNKREFHAEEIDYINKAMQRLMDVSCLK